MNRLDPRLLSAVRLTLVAALGLHGVALAEPGSGYSLPWQLRPVTIGDGARVEGLAAAFKDANGNLDLLVATVVTVSHQATGEWAPMLRVGFVRNDAPGAALDGGSFVNPMVGATYARRLGPHRLALFGATTLPLGTGGGDAPDAASARTNLASATARPSDHAMFAVDYLTAIAGVELAYVSHGFTAQVEGTLEQYLRVRGAKGPVATDLFRTSSALGLHLGYFLGSHLSLGGDLRYQRWLSHPTIVSPRTGARVAVSDADMDSLTLAAGLRLHLGVGKPGALHPGISIVRGLDGPGLGGPLLTSRTTAVQLDLPVTF